MDTGTRTGAALGLATCGGYCAPITGLDGTDGRDPSNATIQHKISRSIDIGLLSFTVVFFDNLVNKINS